MTEGQPIALPPGCPPESASPVVGTFYRLVLGRHREGETAEADSWVLPVNNKKSGCYQRTDQCACLAFSIFSNIDDLVNAQQLVAWARKKAIAQLSLDAEMGIADKTPSEIGDSHHDWWPGTDAVPVAVVVREKP